MNTRSISEKSCELIHICMTKLEFLTYDDESGESG